MFKIANVPCGCGGKMMTMNNNCCRCGAKSARSGGNEFMLPINRIMEHEHFHAGSSLHGVLCKCSFKYIISCSRLHYGFYNGRLLFFCPKCYTHWYVRENEIPNAKIINADLKTSQFILSLLLE